MIRSGQHTLKRRCSPGSTPWTCFRESSNGSCERNSSCKPVAPDAEALPESQPQEREGDQPQRKRIRIRAVRKPPAPAACPPPARSIDDVSFSGAAGCVLAGAQDGSAAVCNCVAQESCNSSLMTYANTPSPRPACFPLRPQDSLAASTITKHAGRAFGSICLSNFALRSGLLMWTLGGEVPPDATIRLQDSLAALPLCELYSINQIDLEKTIEAHKDAEGAVQVASEPPNSSNSGALLRLRARSCCRTADHIELRATILGMPVVVASSQAVEEERGGLYVRSPASRRLDAKSISS